MLRVGLKDIVSGLTAMRVVITVMVRIMVRIRMAHKHQVCMCMQDITTQRWCLIFDN